MYQESFRCEWANRLERKSKNLTVTVFDFGKYLATQTVWQILMEGYLLFRDQKVRNGCPSKPVLVIEKQVSERRGWNEEFANTRLRENFAANNEASSDPVCKRCSKDTESEYVRTCYFSTGEIQRLSNETHAC